MKFCRKEFFMYAMAIAFAVIAFTSSGYAQFSVTISGNLTSPTAPLPATLAAPTGPFTVNAAVSNVPSTLTKVIFYRNDVPYKTFTGSGTSQTLAENQVGQDTYTYRARAYDASGIWVDSNDLKLTVNTPYVFKMGDTISDMLVPIPTSGPSRYEDHTDDIEQAIAHLSRQGGGTLYFPCTQPSAGADISIYNISHPIIIPSNITLQGESSQESVGPCRFYWNNDTNLGDRGCRDAGNTMRDKPMFKVEGDTRRVRIRDMWLLSRTIGRDCGSFGSYDKILEDNTTAIELSASGGSSGNQISDIVIENVAITAFTYGISAVGNSVSDVKLRGIRPSINHRQLFIDANHVYDWDIQNFNINYMLETQGGVEIIRAGAPLSYTGENKKLKFLQLNCNGNIARTPAFCVNVKKHGGLYFKQLHHEGVNQAIIVEDYMSDTDLLPIVNTEPIIFEHSVGTGIFKNASMKLYLIGNNVAAVPDIGQAGLDAGRLNFYGAGINSTVVDCGDVHWDGTDINGGTAAYEDFQMSFTHTERNRASFFIPYGTEYFPKSHTICPAGVSGLADISQIGGEPFNDGVLPMETFLPYSNVFSSSSCSTPGSCAATLQSILNTTANGGTVFIDGSVTVDQTIIIPSGRQMVGNGHDSELVLADRPKGDFPPPDDYLLRINVEVGNNALPRTSGITIRNLKLRRGPGDMSRTGLGIIGSSNTAYPGASSDMHFSGLIFEGFDKGLEVARLSDQHPMIDGTSWKNIKFVNNRTAAEVFSSNLSNWNIMNLQMESNAASAVGWHQTTSGTSMQNVTCRGTNANASNLANNNMEHCIKLDIAGIHLSGLKPTVNVTNALTIGENIGLGFPAPYESTQFSSIVLRNNDFRSTAPGRSRINLTGKVFITSMNNKYSYFNVALSSEANLSRLTYCADSFDNGTVTTTDDGAAYPGLADRHPNLYVGVPTPTRITCGTRPVPWDDTINWGAERKNTTTEDYYSDDTPLAGNFFDDVRDDHVIYRKLTTGQFRIRQYGAGPGSTPKIVNMTTASDYPMIGRFFTNARAQVVIWRAPAMGTTWEWEVKDPDTTVTNTYSWGITGDVPFIGNFIAESGTGITDDLDEIAIYRPSDKTIWIMNPRTGQYVAISRVNDYGSKIQVGDFRGVGYDQIAQYDSGVWTIYDVRANISSTATLGGTTTPLPEDVPVAGKYLTGVCTQIGIWRPSTQQFIVKDPFSSCGTRKETIIWGSNNDSTYTTGTLCPGGYCVDDIPLKMRIDTVNGPVDRPTAYRPTKGVYPRSISNGQWWVHDLF